MLTGAVAGREVGCSVRETAETNGYIPCGRIKKFITGAGGVSAPVFHNNISCSRLCFTYISLIFSSIYNLNKCRLSSV